MPREEEDRDSECCQGIVDKKGEGKTKKNFEVERAPLHYTREVGKKMTSSLSYQGHHVSNV